MAPQRVCRICNDPILEERHTNAVTCGDLCAAENDRRNRNRSKRETRQRLRAAVEAAKASAATG